MMFISEFIVFKSSKQENKIQIRKFSFKSLKLGNEVRIGIMEYIAFI